MDNTHRSAGRSPVAILDVSKMDAMRGASMIKKRTAPFTKVLSLKKPGLYKRFTQVKARIYRLKVMWQYAVSARNTK